MTTTALTLTNFICDRCSTKATSRSADELPPGWIALQWFAHRDTVVLHQSDGRLEGVSGMAMRTLHFERPDCLAWWLTELPIKVGLRDIGAGNADRVVGDAVGWSGRSPDHLWGCPSCGIPGWDAPHGLYAASLRRLRFVWRVTLGGLVQSREAPNVRSGRSQGEDQRVVGRALALVRTPALESGVEGRGAHPGPHRRRGRSRSGRVPAGRRGVRDGHEGDAADPR